MMQEHIRSMRSAALARPYCTTLTIMGTLMASIAWAKLASRDLAIAKAPPVESPHDSVADPVSFTSYTPPPIVPTRHNPFAIQPDPLVPLVESGSHEDSLRLTAVVLAAEPSAIINGQLVRVGDTVESCQVVEISKEGVSLRSSKGMVMVERSSR